MEILGYIGAVLMGLVLGGSQGARALNKTIPEALAKAGLRDAKVRVVHQTGAAMRDEVEARYRDDRRPRA